MAGRRSVYILKGKREHTTASMQFRPIPDILPADSPAHVVVNYIKKLILILFIIACAALSLLEEETGFVIPCDVCHWANMYGIWRGEIARPRREEELVMFY